MLQSDAEEDLFHTNQSTDQRDALSPAQRSAIADIVSQSVQSALQAVRTNSAFSPTPSSQTLAPSGMASPLGLSRPVDRNMEDKILRENSVVPRRCALTSTSPPGAGAETAATRTFAAAATPTATPSKTALSNTPVAQPGTQESPDLVSEARSKVEQQRRHQKPLVSSPIDIYRLDLELTNHPDRKFVFNLLSTLKEGARIGYCGPRSARVSPNLISATQHPDVVSANLEQEVNLGRVAGPYAALPLANVQCHPVGAIPKKHSSD